jgi:hypothetical protein
LPGSFFVTPERSRRIGEAKKKIKNNEGLKGKTKIKISLFNPNATWQKQKSK